MPDGELAQLTLRPAALADAPRCAAIFLAGRRDACPWRPPELFRLDDYDDCVAGETVWVAELRGRVVGFVSGVLADNVVRNLFVDTGWRNLGIGRALLTWALRFYGGTVHLRCSSRNTCARAFYRGRGWHEAQHDTTGDGEFVVFRKIVPVGLNLQLVNTFPLSSHPPVG